MRRIISKLECPLCFTFTKFSKIYIKRNKTAVTDFYEPEKNTAAITRSICDADALKLDGMPIIAKRRNSGSRHQRECDDILHVITFLDDHKLHDKLPHYACDSLRYFPSSRMDEADMRMLLSKLEIMQKNIIATRKIIEKNQSLLVKSSQVKSRFDLY